MISRLLLSLVCVTWVHASGSSSLVRIACARDPSLTFCQQHEMARNEEQLDANRIVLDRYRYGTFAQGVRVARQEGGDHKDSDLREKERELGHDEGFIEEIESASSHSSSGTQSQDGELLAEDTEDNSFKGGKAQYCDKYEQHFSFYCVGDHDAFNSEAAQFCPSYKNACSHKAVTSTASVSWPSDPFSSRSGVRPTPTVRVASESSEEEEVSEKDLYYAELKRRFPCKPECDVRIFPHCTEDCKCDYMYPAVQRFCNPPPLPLFLNTCRLWYHGCPKYEAYHYNSQFLYSKAEKGKVLPGPQGTNPNPYNIPQPSTPISNGAVSHPRPHAIPSPLQPIMKRSKRDTRATREILVIPPELPSFMSEKQVEPREEDSSEVIDVLSRVQHKHSDSTHGSTTRRKHKRRYQHEPAPTVPMPNEQKLRELYRVLRKLNGLTSHPVDITKDLLGHGQQDPTSVEGITRSVKDFATDIVRDAPTEDRPTTDSSKENSIPENFRARAHGPGVPVVASDAAYSDEDTFKKFDHLTDSRGILHRPRSRSPFSKPGLWEANPDNPHNRDHANKWYYHPRSVGVDWLNGNIQWGAHWAVPAANTGGTDGMSTVHFPTIGNFLNIPDDYD